MDLDEPSRQRALQIIRDLRAWIIPEEDMAEREAELERILRCPQVTKYIFFEDPELTDEQVVERALQDRPIEL